MKAKLKSKLKPWEKITWDLGTAHVTKRDAEMLNTGNLVRHKNGMRSCCNEYGWVVFIPTGLDADDLENWKTELEMNDWSEALINILIAASKSEVGMVNFDQDGDTYDEWPAFEW